MDEGMQSEQVTEPEKPAKSTRWQQWAAHREDYVRPEPPEGYRDSKRWILVPDADVLKRGHYSKVWGYNARTIARLVGVVPAVVRKAVQRGDLLPHDLGSVMRWAIGQMRPADVIEIEQAPPLWRFYEPFTLLMASPHAPRGRHLLPLAVPMPRWSACEDLVRLFWSVRGKLKSFSGSSYALAQRILQLDGVKPEDLPPRPPRSHVGPTRGKRDPHRAVASMAVTLRKLVEYGVILHDKAAGTWVMAPFPRTLEGIADGLRGEGFEAVVIVERHIIIERDWFALDHAKRLLMYMRTNRLRAKDCGRDRRMWIVTGMDRVMHGYRERKIYRTPPKGRRFTSGSRAPTDSERPA